MTELTDFQEKLFRKLEEIPEGKVTTYGQLAEMVGSAGAALAVGNAMKSDAAAQYPCWRVVGSDGSLHVSGFGDEDDQREKLKQEGVQFEDENTVDLTRSQYRGS